MEDKDGWIWFDGEFVPWRDARVHVLTHTLHYGMGVFEGVRAYNTDQGTAIFRLKEHNQRLFNSAKILEITVPYQPEELYDVQKETIRKNNFDSAYLRPMVFYGAEGMGLRADHLKVHCIVAAWQWGTYLGEENIACGIRVKTSSFARHHVNTAMCRAKANGYYINSMLALQEAFRQGYDEALMLDTNGYVAEGSGENIFIVKDNVLYTPDLSSVLDGITRRTVIELAQDQGLSVVEKRITRDEVYLADEAFFTGTAAEVMPIRELDGRVIGHGSRGAVTKRLQTLFFDVVYGRSERYQQWLEFI